MPVPGNSGTVAVSRRLLVDDVYDRILGAIYSGQFAPGEKLNDAELCGWLGTSRTPIRQALARLENQGLVETAANRWTRVTRINPDRYRKSVPVIASLYRVAAIDGTPNLTEATNLGLHKALRLLRQGFEQHDADKAFRGFMAATRRVSDLADNPVLSEALNVVMPRLCRVNAIYILQLPEATVEAFERAVHSLETGDPIGAGHAWYQALFDYGSHVSDLLDADALQWKYETA